MKIEQEKVVFFKDGRIAEQGTFEDWSRKGGEFASLLAEQNRK